MQILELSLVTDLNTKVFEYISENCLLIYPTRAAAEQARLEYEARWSLQNLRFSSMEDFKASLLLPAGPVPEDDKRLLALYQVLSLEDREYFHLYNYQDLVAWGTEFFGFCSELSEAEIAFSELATWPDNPDLSLRDWQEKNILRLLQIGERYRAFIQARGFDDLIFHPGAQAVDIPLQGWRIICVNQYYYSSLERSLLKECEKAGNELLLVLQGVKSLNNGFDHKPLNLQEAWESLSTQPQIQIVEAENEGQAALSFLAREKGSEPLGIIDSSFLLKSYSAYFDADKLKSPTALSISNFRWYRTQRILLEILEEMQQNASFIPIRLILKYFGSLEAVKPFVPAWQPADFTAFRYQLQYLIQHEIIYLDLDIGRQFDDPTSRVYQFCSALASVLKQILQIRKLKDLLALLEGELSPQKYSSEYELNNSDLLARAWEAMANFLAIENLAFVQDWASVFTNPALDIFQLWLDQLKSLKLKRKFSEKPAALWEITNLLDARNRRFERLAVFNLVEGVLPSSPHAIWLLNEYQRQKLGMKCYEDIRDWERYYFFRLLLSSREATLYTYIDKDKAIDHSSFIGELKVLFADTPLQIRKCKVAEEHLLNAWRAQADTKRLNLSPDIYYSLPAKDFFVIPSQPEQDFSRRRLTFSSYHLQLFVTNPFVWYISGLRAISPLRIPRREMISPILFGLLLHDYFSEVLAQDDSVQNSYQELDKIFNDNDLLSKALKQIIDSEAYRYKIPKNYNYDFLNYIVSERLAISLQEFYKQYLQTRIQRGAFRLIPENAEKGNLERRLYSPAFAGNAYEIVLRGRADLRLECANKYYIVDFKTGGASSEQLIFYEWLYYLLEKPELAEQIESAFWRILDMDEAREKSDAKKREKYMQQITEAVEKNFGNGYALAQKAADRTQYWEISRSDLSPKGGKDE